MTLDQHHRAADKVQPQGSTISAEAQQHLVDSSNHWLKANSAASTELVKNGTLPATQFSEYSDLKKERDGLVQGSGVRQEDVLKAHNKAGATGDDIEAKDINNRRLEAGFKAAFDSMFHGTFNGDTRGFSMKALDNLQNNPLLSPEQKADIKYLNDAYKKGEINDLTGNGIMTWTTLQKGMKERDKAVGEEGKAYGEQVKSAFAATDGAKRADDRLKDLGEGLKPSDAILAAAHVKRGQGYHQVAEQMLGTDGQKHSEAEVKALTKALQEQAIADNDGKAPKHLSSKNPLVTEQNFAQLMERMRAKMEELKQPAGH